MKNAINEIIKSSFEEMNQTRAEKIDTSEISSISIYGNNGVFDSMGVVNFITIVEEAIYDELDIEVSIMSERALSMKNSPFSNAKNLAEFIELEINNMEAA